MEEWQNGRGRKCLKKQWKNGEIDGWKGLKQGMEKWRNGSKKLLVQTTSYDLVQSGLLENISGILLDEE